MRFFCFQTVWTDVYTWIEEKLEGAPAKRQKLDKAPLSFEKIRTKGVKHLLWLIIAFITGIGFITWFVDAQQFWIDLLSFNLGTTALITLALFTVGTYVLAGFLREQACFWLCPYARIQAVMVDNSTAVPTYDFHRGSRVDGSEGAERGRQDNRRLCGLQSVCRSLSDRGRYTPRPAGGLHYVRTLHRRL